MTEKWGYLRETKEKAQEAGIDPDTGLHRTGLDEYLKKIFPEIDDWEHDKCIPNIERKFRPDYRSEKLKLIVEFDGLPHYTKPDIILKDKEKTDFYQSLNYTVVRIPFFIQLTNKVIKKLFGRDVKEQMFNEKFPSLTVGSMDTPAFLCGAGIKRMKKELQEISPEQLQVNIEALEKENNEYLTGVSFLK